jgi:hypothetical protein
MFAQQFGSAQHAFETLFDFIQDKGGSRRVVRNVSIELVSPKINEIATPWRNVKFINREYLENDFTLNFHEYLDELNLTIYIRSIDLVYGFCNSQQHFSRLLQDVALKLKLQVGNITFMITELFIHEEHFSLKTNYTNGNDQTKSQDSQGS